MSAGLHDTERERGNYWRRRALEGEARIAKVEDQKAAVIEAMADNQARVAEACDLLREMLRTPDLNVTTDAVEDFLHEMKGDEAK